MVKKIIFRVRESDRAIFEAVLNGKKKVETRAATSKFAKIKAGDSIILICGKDRLEKQVKKAKIFKTIPAMLKEYYFKDINPLIGSVKELEKMYSSFPGYEEKIKKCGLIALEIK
jgi:ASC-1-like (ASCH) protein